MFDSYTSKCNDSAIFGSLLYESFAFGTYKNDVSFVHMQVHEGTSAELCIVLPAVGTCSQTASPTLNVLHFVELSSLNSVNLTCRRWRDRQHRLSSH
ncbi:hypothetical protein EMCRGX_G032772 [Ephydatia muelleri]